ncbi:MAG: hypothetical protein MUC48_04065 [Leptolyngbya sp. Prado105]|jgi:hypothetical protein|nr:hypothetical protein [Leptolyngbya sp. Prado105]
MTDLTTVLQFISDLEQSHPDASAYEITNRLRGYTKPSYTTTSWTVATGFEQGFIEGKLNQDVILAGELTDFGHFIASLSDQSLSDQMNQPGLKWSDLTRWTGDHTSWAGDIGSAIEIYRATPDKFKGLGDALDRFASDSDYVADVAAWAVGTILNRNAQMRVSKAIETYHAQPYSEQVRTFIQRRFNGILDAQVLMNPAKIEAEIRTATFAYLELSQNASALKQLMKSFTQKLRSNVDRDLLSADLLQGSLHFMAHLIHKANLAPLKFKPYQQPQAPWLGTVNYEVSIELSNKVDRLN